MKIPIRPDNDPQPKEVEPVWDEPESYGQTGNLDEQGEFIPLPPEKIEPTSKETISKFKKWLKNWEHNELLPWVMGMAGYKFLPKTEALRHRLDAFITGILNLFPKHPGGRPPKLEGAMSDADRKRKQRQFEKTFDWVFEQAFPVLVSELYLVIETSFSDEMPLFDMKRGVPISGSELRSEMIAHHETYPHPEKQSNSHDNEWLRLFVDETTGLVLEYPDKNYVRYFIPDIRTPNDVDDILQGESGWSLSNGMFIKDAPHGLGLLISGWRQPRYSLRRPGMANENPSLEKISDIGQIGMRKVKGTGAHIQVGPGEDIESEDSEPPEPRCKLCHTVIEDDYLQALKHLEMNHPAEFQQVREAALQTLQEKGKEAKRQERRLADKQKRCREDHDAIFQRRLKEDQTPHWYECGSCGAYLCQGRHTQMVEEELAKRTAYLAQLPYREYQDAIKEKQDPIYCQFCHSPIYKTEFDLRIKRPKN